MKRIFLSLIFIALAATACQPTTNISAITPPYIDTGVDPEAWVTVPAGNFPYGQESHLTSLDYDYQIMVTDVTVSQYAEYLNSALASGDIYSGDFTVEAGEQVWTEKGVGGYYPGDPFQGGRHEEKIKAGDHLFLPFVEGVRLNHSGDVFTPVPEYANHPMTMVTWFGANAYCQYYGGRLPLAAEWEKAARGIKISNDDGLPFPWGEEIHRNNANYYSSFDLFEKMYGKLGNTTPVGFYNGRTYTVDGLTYQTLDSASPYGLYDMAGNVWQWLGDDLPYQHYRYMRGGSFYSYEVDLRVWKENSAGPQFYSPQVGFRCVRYEVK